MSSGVRLQFESIVQVQESLKSLTEEGVDAFADTIAASVFAQSVEELVHFVAVVTVMCQYRFANIGVFARLMAKLRERAADANVLRELYQAILAPLISIRATHPSRMVFIEECVKLGALTNEELCREIAKFGEWWPYDDVPKLLLFIWHHENLRVTDKALFDQMLGISNEIVKKIACVDEVKSILDAINAGDVTKSVHTEIPDDSLVVILEKDDVRGLDDMVKSGIDMNGVLKLSMFQYCDLLRNDPTVLQFCACHCRYKCFKYAFENGASPERWALGEYAVCGGSKEIMELLVKKGISFLRGALQACALFGRFDMFEWLTSLEWDGKKLDIHENSEFGSIFHKAAIGNDLKFLLYCIDNGFDVNMTAVAPGIVGYTPLHCAAENGRLDAVKVLVSVQGVDVNCKTATGATPLLLSAATGQLDVVKLFAQRTDVDMKAVDKEGKNALVLAVENGWFGVVKYILSADFLDPNDGDAHGMTPLHWAAQSGKYGMCKMLLDSGKADVNCQDNDRLTPLHWASSHGHIDVVKLLLNHPSINPNLLDDIGMTALIRAVECEHTAVVAELLTHPNVAVNHGMNGRTALIVAVEKHDPAIVEMLLKSPSIDTSIAYQSITPLEWARAAKFNDIVRLFTK